MHTTLDSTLCFTFGAKTKEDLCIYQNLAQVTRQTSTQKYFKKFTVAKYGTHS